MARDMLYDEYNGQRDRISQNWNMQCESAKSKGENPPEHPGLPSIPSEADIISKAQTLNGFVSNNTAPETPKVSVKKTS
jgi:hypothetical protein